MRHSRSFRSAAILVSILLAVPQSWGQIEEELTVQAASMVFDEMMSTSLMRIPQALLSEAYGIAIVPNVIKGGFVVGARYGKGLLLVRDEQSNWQAPVFVSLTGGNIGWQIGVQSTDVVLVFATRKSVQGLLSGTFTIGADAAVAAGPVGRKAAVATNGQLKAEIYSYSRSRGVFVGVSIDGSAIRVDRVATAEFYQNHLAGQASVVPPSALRLVEKVSIHTDTPRFRSAVNHPATFAPVVPGHPDDEAEAVRNQLAQTASELYSVLDPTWKSFLALPSTIFGGAARPSSESLNEPLARFEAVSADTRYHVLSDQSRFRSTHGLLRQYVEILRRSDDPLTLPPPPAVPTTSKMIAPPR